MELQTDNALEAWFTLLTHVHRSGKESSIHSRRYKEIYSILLSLRSPIFQLEDPIHLLSSMQEWIFPSKEELRDSILADLANPFSDFNYGKRIFNFKGKLNQVDEFLVPLLEKDPSSRRGVLSFYDPLVDSIPGKISPSLLSIIARVSAGHLSLTAIFRSSDVFIGLPANIFQLSVLQSFLAKKLRLKPGDLSFFLVNAHYYLEHESAMTDLAKRVGKTFK
ncbi:MAG: hypothetical protein H6502_04460 [Candidatus Woesearchaeota archaeon]|nr:MAG: hypothetical protein H6502_04460 [Candidatus Woesearchaeota archaeon]